MIQGSEEWLQDRAGSLGGSTIGEAFTRLKRKSGDSPAGERTAKALDLMYECAAEQITGQPARQVNALRWGRDNEEAARTAYAFQTNALVIKVAIIHHPRIDHAHASPDSLVGDDGGLEIKCPTSATHLRTWLEGRIPEDHLPQVHWNLACSGRAWWDFASFDPRFPPHMQLFVRRLERDEAAIAYLETEAQLWLAEVAALRRRAVEET